MTRLLLELAINQLLSTAPLTQARLKKLEGKTLAVELEQPHWHLVFAIRQGKVLLLDQAQHLDAQIGFSMPSLLSLLRHQDKVQALKDLPLQIQGDTKVLMALAELMQQPDFEPEVILAPLIGQQATAILSLVRTHLLQWLTQLVSQQQASLEHWLVHESQQLVNQQEFREHQRRISELRRNLQRLNQQLPGSQT